MMWVEFVSLESKHRYLAVANWTQLRLARRPVLSDSSRFTVT